MNMIGEMKTRHGIFNMLVQSDELKYFGFLLPLATYIPLVIALVIHVKNKKEASKNIEAKAE